jgi:1,4-alpha-glucan branching enzyme
MGWMNDTLEYFSKDPVHRKFHHQDLTFSMIYAFTENFILPISHDEVVHGKKALLDKMPGDMWQKFANLRLFLAYMYAHPGKKLLFMGSEIGQWSEWKHEDSLDWSLLENEPHKKTQQFLTQLNHLYRNEKALWQVDFDWQGFEWLDYQDWENSIISFVRYGKDKSDYIVAIFNFTPVPRINYRIGVPEKCFYKEILNSDAKCFFGSDVGNMGGVNSDEVSWGLRNFSLRLTIPPLGALYLKPVRSSE